MRIFSKIKGWLERRWRSLSERESTNRRILVCDCFGSARFYSWEVVDGVETNFRYISDGSIVANNFTDFIEHVGIETTAKSAQELIQVSVQS